MSSELPPQHDIEGGAGAQDWRRALGEQRFEAFVTAVANLDAMKAMLIFGITGVGLAGYSDEAIEHAEGDVKDLERAARNLATVSRQLLDEWKRQRRRAERERQR
jgi:hypothetical protein